MLRQLKLAFTSSKFLAGFIIFFSIFILALIYPLFTTWDPLQLIMRPAFAPPGTYINIQDVVQIRHADRRQFLVDVDANRLGNVLGEEDVTEMIYFLEVYMDFEPGYLCPSDQPTIIYHWNNLYDPDLRIQGMTLARHRHFQRFNTRLQVALDGTVILAYRDEYGYLQEVTPAIHTAYFVPLNQVVNRFRFPLGTDGHGRDMLTQLLSAILVSLRLGLIAGLIATSIGLTLGLLAGYISGFVDDAILFVTNLFTVIPSFILLILI